jgi:hypothetical protein
MNFREQLGTELSRRNIDFVIYTAGDRQDCFDELMDIVLHGELPLPTRAAWAAEGVCEKHPALVKSHIPALIDNLHHFVQDGTRRSVLKILSREVIPEDYLGTLTDLCFGYLVDAQQPVAIKMYSMLILSRQMEKYPELATELQCIIEDQYDRGSSGFKSIARKILKKIQRFSSG